MSEEVETKDAEGEAHELSGEELEAVSGGSGTAQLSKIDFVSNGHTSAPAITNVDSNGKAKG